MISNANHPAVRRIRTLNRIAYGAVGGGVVGCGFGLYSKNIVFFVGGAFVAGGGVYIHRRVALEQYRSLVANGAVWDFKDEIGRNLGPGITLCSGGTCYRDIEYSVPGNVHFAYIGRAAGILGWEIQYGAGWAQINDPAHIEGSGEYVGPYEGERHYDPLLDPSQWNFGDEPTDHEAVTFGIALWSKYKGSSAKVTLLR
jgi:hypothetical protein